MDVLSREGDRTSAVINDRQNRVHKGIDDKSTQRQANIDKKLVPALWIIVLPPLLERTRHWEDQWSLLDALLRYTPQ